MSKRRLLRLTARAERRAKQRAVREKRAEERAQRNAPRARILAFVEQFPAVFEAEDGYYLRANPERVEAVSVAPFERELLSFRPRRESSDGNLVGVDDRQRVLLFGADWELLGEAEPDHEWWTPREQGFAVGESVADAILRVGADRVAWVVEIHHGWRIEEHHSVGGYDVVIHCAGERPLLEEWVTEEMGAARREVAEELAAAVAFW